MPWIELLGHDIHYREAGSGQPLVLIHGSGSAAACWEPIMEALSQYHVYAYDSVNHGFSANSPRGQAEPDRADELEALLLGAAAEVRKRRRPEISVHIAYERAHGVRSGTPVFLGEAGPQFHDPAMWEGV